MFSKSRSPSNLKKSLLEDEKHAAESQYPVKPQFLQILFDEIVSIAQEIDASLQKITQKLGANISLDKDYWQKTIVDTLLPFGKNQALKAALLEENEYKEFRKNCERLKTMCKISIGVINEITRDKQSEQNQLLVRSKENLSKEILKVKPYLDIIDVLFGETLAAKEQPRLKR